MYFDIGYENYAVFLLGYDTKMEMYEYYMACELFGNIYHIYHSSCIKMVVYSSYSMKYACQVQTFTTFDSISCIK